MFGSRSSEVRVIRLCLARLGFCAAECGLRVIRLCFEPQIAQNEQRSAGLYRRTFLSQNLGDLPGNGRANRCPLLCFKNKPATYGLTPHGREQDQNNAQGCRQSPVRPGPQLAKTLLSVQVKVLHKPQRGAQSRF